MIISHSNSYIFIKSAKTAGTSIEAALSKYCSGNDIVTPLGDYQFNRNEKGEWIHQDMNSGDFKQHEWGIAVRDKVGQAIWNSYFKFSVARNPWDRMVSLFTWMARNDPALQPKKRLSHRIGLPFDEFEETRKLFAKFIKSGNWDTNDRFYVIDDALCVDYVVRYENLSIDFLEVCKKVGLPPIELPRLKSGLRPGQHHYSDYYDQESRAIVGESHRHDVELLGYKFEEA